MKSVIYLIGLEPTQIIAIKAVSERRGYRVESVAGPAEISTANYMPRAIALAPFFGPDTFQTTIETAYRRGVTTVAAMLAQPDFATTRAAFRSGAEDVLADPLNETEINGFLDHMSNNGHRAMEPMQIRTLQELEQDAIAQALQACRGQVSLTARRLGIGRSTLYRKLDEYGLENPR